MDIAARERVALEIRSKGFLGPTLKENRGLPSIGARAARNVGVVLDETGKMRCPEGTPGAGRFTDIQKTNCDIPLSGKRLPLDQNTVDFKVGLFHSHGRLGRAAQAAGSRALPGDSSKLRSPVSSEVHRALIPGGGGRRRLGTPIGGGKFRCPAGFENGGRFADDINGCGIRLFEPHKGQGVRPHSAAAAAAATASRAARRAAQTGYDPNVPDAGDKRGRRITGTRFNRNPVQIRRSLELGHVGAFDQKKHDSAVRRASRLIESDVQASYLVRRDGEVLKPQVKQSLLAKMVSNPDMKDGTLVVSGRKGNLGETEVPLLINSPLKAVAFTATGGDYATLTKLKKPNPDEARRLTALVTASPGAASVYSMSKASGGAFKFEWSGRTDLGDVRVRPANGGATRTVPRWVYDTFLKRDATAHDGGITWELVKAE
jgi:hypothetical protein